ncbi:MAG: ADP-ribosyl-[dinitrogen reductase] hydrolase [Sulfurimicrobium sp.]|nr:ADP-ribosyl-[dinitrogen reductase] hydrolase [Sulfurimicrobium sp.]MDP1703219.1 ADP-ribosyl-[dinitrogen reductase] hydrolase [Sulfurimicrobium sp.]MDP2196951.1 ADP-ribosyl-[dinitrogen reductase] hydrolase [Sulfurimicrobium sp.]MDP3688007.1 ADP-ribosyl-[dinitrogen reductase] hydrolase [Sulfurimicrobium sp.]MDZ7654348.1 ADP-ribosyl-[dinitrogen reductase] hydrolase [Sulfurimicrobium sp.]
MGLVMQLHDAMNASPSTLHNRALGAYLGLACGDALGATVEFMTPREIQSRYGTHRDISGGGWLRLVPGQVTDDTEMSLHLGQAIIESKGWNLNAIADSFATWLKSRPVDVGATCRRGIRRYMLGGGIHGPESDSDGGNGAAMRNLPVALYTLGDAARFERYTLEQSHITHHHALADAGTLALGNMTQILLLGGGVKECRPIATRLVEAHRQFRFDPYPGRASGYIVDTVQTVLHHFFYTDSFESCVVETVNRGEDADTTGALAGMLAGALYGADAIPKRWLDKLDYHVTREIEHQVAALLQMAPVNQG